VWVVVCVGRAQGVGEKHLRIRRDCASMDEVVVVVVACIDYAVTRWWHTAGGFIHRGRPLCVLRWLAGGVSGVGGR
jgi:hypothetical protein